MNARGAGSPAGGKSPRTVVLVTRLGAATLPGLLMSVAFGRHVLLLEQARTGWVGRLAARMGARCVDFSSLSKIDIRDVYGDLHGAAGRTARACWDESAARMMCGLFPGVRETEKKLWILVRTFVDARCSTAAVVSTWARCALQQFPRIVVTGPLDRISASYLAGVSHDIRLGPLVPFYQALETMSKIGAKIVSRLRSPSRQGRRAGGAKLPGFQPGSAPVDVPVLFFPHKTVSYGGLFLKDQFYSDDPASVFHASRIMHVEIEPVEEHWCTPELVETYRRLGVRYCSLDAGGERGLAASLLAFLKHLKRIRALASAATAPRFAYIVFRQWRRFDAYRQCLSRFPSAKIALVGYEMLFPVPLSLALESRGIRTIATQERLLASTCYRNWNYVLDSYLVASRHVAEAIADDPGKHVTNLVPTGLVRSDLIREFEGGRDRGPAPVRARGQWRSHVLVFDFHSVRDPRANAMALVNNWRANRAFYEDILRLANSFPRVHFTIRSKNADWQGLDRFADIVDAFARQGNVELNRDYSRTLVSYRLAADCDAVIAKHTSIAEECMATGKPTVLYDYLPNAERTVSLAWDYGGVAVFVNSYDELKQRVATILERGHYLDDAEISRLQAVVNGGPADGRVRSRVARELDRCWRDVGRGDDCRAKPHLAV